MPTAPIVQLLLVLTLGIIALALWKGSPAERVGAGLILAIDLLRIASGYVLPAHLEPITRMGADFLTALSLLAVAVRYASLWLGGAMLLYAAQFSLHSFYFVTHKAPDRLHAIINNVDFLGISLCLALGVLVALRRRSRERPLAAAPSAA